MRRKKINCFSLVILGLSLLISAAGLEAQVDSSGPFGFTRCVLVKPTKKMIKEIRNRLRDYHHPSSFQPKQTVSIPVYFHIIQDSSFSNPTTEDQLASQVEVLNAAFANGGISFSTAGTDQTVNDEWALNLGSVSQAQYEMKSALRIGGAEALNIYLTIPGDNLLGYASFPWYYASDPLNDGIVLFYASLPGGTASAYNLGHTAVHEVGHWLGLFHTFQPGPRGANGCKDPGDLISDTPPEKIPHYQCRSSNSCRKQPGVDPIHNYMNYTPDSCMFEFTAGQFSLMQELHAIYRLGQ